MPLARRTVLISLILLISSTAAIAETYVVDGAHPLADDTNPGTLEAPWLTVQHAADTLAPGDTVLIREGLYNEYVETTTSGSSAEGPICFLAFPGEQPVIDGTDIGASVGLRIAHGHLLFQGLELTNWTTGIWMAGAHDLVLRELEVHDVCFGIGAGYGTHDFLLDRVEIHHFTLYGFDASPSGGADCYNGTFNDCLAHTCNDPEQNVDGFALGHGGQHSFVFNRCEAYGVYDGFDISARSTVLNRCSAHDCDYRGLSGWQDSLLVINSLLYRNGICNAYLIRGQSAPHHYRFINCTFMDADVFNVITDSTGAGISLEMSNCILAGGDNVGLWLEELGGLAYQGDHNLFHNDNPARAIWAGAVDEFSLEEIEAGDWTAFSGQDEHSWVAALEGDVFVDPAGFDLHLAEMSPAIDHGTPAGAPPDDYEGNPRPAGAGYDIGAFEDQSAGSADPGQTDVAGDPLRLRLWPAITRKQATLSYVLPAGGPVQVSVYGPAGRLLGPPGRRTESAGPHQHPLDLPSLQSGVIWVRVEFGGNLESSSSVLCVR